MAGTVRLSENLLLRGVLYMPDLSVELISMLIGAGTRKDGLYHFMPIPNVSHVAATTSLESH
ncbi:hypothetical protein V2J09_000267 [Rumex salicifolius]